MWYEIPVPEQLLVALSQSLNYLIEFIICQHNAGA